MTERTDFEARLAARLATHAAAVDGPFDSLAIAQSAIAAGTARRSIWERVLPPIEPSRRAVLALMLIALLAIAVATAVAVGSGLIRFPREQLDLERLLGAQCDRFGPEHLPRGQLIEFRYGLDEPVGEFAPPAGGFVRVFDDWRYMTGHGRTSAQIAAGDPGMTVRRLTPSGLAMVTEMVRSSGVIGSCLDSSRDVPYHSLALRTGDRDVTAVAWGRGYASEFIRLMSDDEADDAARLEQGLRAPETWLPDDAWVGSDVEDPERWRVAIYFLPPMAAPSRGSGEFDGDRPPVDTVVLQDGTPLGEFGGPWRVPASAGVPEQTGRCAVVSSDAALELTRALNATGATIFNGAWWFRDGTTDAAAVSMQPMIDPNEGCSLDRLGVMAPADVSPDPVARATVPPLGSLGTLEPCEFLPVGAVNHALPFTERFPLRPKDEADGGRPSRLGQDFRECTYRNENGGASATVAVHGDAITVPEARVIAAELFGEGAVEQVLDGRAIWLNGCVGEGHYSCAPAIAVAAVPYFVVISFGSVEGDRGRIALDLASAIVVPGGAQ